MDIATETDKVKAFVDKGNYHAAFNIALSDLNQCHRNNDQAGVDTFLGLIKQLVASLAEKFGSQDIEERSDS